MTVKIIFPHRKHGDTSVVLELDDAKEEIENAAKNGYIAVYNGKQVLSEDLQDDQELHFYPTGVGG